MAIRWNQERLENFYESRSVAHGEELMARIPIVGMLMFLLL